MVSLYTDGGCHGNPGPGGWAFRIVDGAGTVVDEASGGDAATTNNRMELTAVIRGLEVLDGRAASVTVVTDSQYVRQGITDWINRWKRNGWLTAAKKPVKNSDLWRTLDALNARVAPAWRWTRGHAGDTHNEACDRMVQRAIAALER